MRRTPSTLGRIVATFCVAGIAAPQAVHAQGALGPLNDLGALVAGDGQTPAKVPVQRNAEPALTAAPRAVCGAGARPEPGIQGRVPAGSATNGLHCNATLLAHQGTSGGFKVLRYVDTAGRECAYYDTALLFPLNALKLDATSVGVAVIDMSDPSRPVQTDTLTEPAMLSPHESLNLNVRRGLIAAVLGNPATAPGLVSIYDAHEDCRHPQLQSTQLVAKLGHESGFSQDGRTFYANGTATTAITAIDVTDPKHPRDLWQGNVVAHGMTLSDDGNRAYVADPLGHNLLILDTSEIQARKPDPQVREVSRLAWKSSSIPQNALPFTKDGHPYVLEFDEYNAGALGGSPDDVGAARIIDIGDERAPRVVGNLRLQVNQAADHKAAAGDPGAFSPVQGYGAHYCNIPTRTDPTVVACSFIASGLRVFDITDLTTPKEIAYYVAPTVARVENGFQASDFAMSMPAFAADRKEIWYTDGTSGFNVVRIDPKVWPAAPALRCASRRRFTASLTVPRGAQVRRIVATLGGKRVKTTRRGRSIRAIVDLRGLRRLSVRLTIRATLRSGRTVATTRTYHPCRGR